ncbi:MAG: prefoldin subunit alpha [Candidatus Aenigmarchaeota archaeon]|nr:prefoldin subunit alpha [Candidatus Aenigmarchaeota archaeon]
MVDKKQKEMQEKVLVYQILQNQLEEFTQQATAIETRLAELELTTHALKEMKGVEPDSETLFHMGGGCYGHGKLTDRSKFLIEVGAGIMANKTLPDAIAIIDERKNEVEKIKDKLLAEIEKIGDGMNQIGLELQKLNREGGGKDDSGITVD